KNITSVGSFPSRTAPNKKIRTVKLTPGVLSVAVQATSTVTIQKDSNITPVGSDLENQPADLQSVLGYTKEQIKTMAAHNYDETTAPDDNTYSGIITITASQGATIDLQHLGTQSGKNCFLLIDCSAQNTNVKITGNGTFTGVVWIIGSSDVGYSWLATGNPTFTGAIVNEGSCEFKGSSNVTYNQTEVERAVAFAFAGAGVNIKPSFWHES
ncbi:MAG: hypothetical protein NT079_00740, partial [Candidatus Omnitrophica bacterium]|nr:hypothetical protein [Candidatus Omnitrophota bacterium]